MEKLMRFFSFLASVWGVGSLGRGDWSCYWLSYGFGDGAGAWLLGRPSNWGPQYGSTGKTIREAIPARTCILVAIAPVNPQNFKVSICLLPLDSGEGGLVLLGTVVDSVIAQQGYGIYD